MKKKKLKRSKKMIAGAALAMTLAASAQSQAAIHTVDSWTSLETAFQNAQAADTITFGPNPGGTVTLEGALYTNSVVDGLTLTGNGWTLNLGGARSRDNFLLFRSDIDALTGLTVTGTEQFGAITIDDDFSGSINNLTFYDNQETLSSGGGGLSVSGHFSGKITASTFSRNQTGGSAGSGGALKIDDGFSGTINQTIFTDNRAVANGGAIFAAGNISGRLSDSIFTANIAGQDGGAIYAGGGLSGGLYGSDFIGNVANKGGGAVYVSRDLSGGIKNATFLDNESEDFGGAVHIAQNLLDGISASLFVNNMAEDINVSEGGGAAVYVGGGLTGGVTGSAFVGNVVIDYSSGISNGGALYVNTLIEGGISRSAFINNSATNDGGAVYVGGSLQGDIEASLFANNGGREGGALFAGALTGRIIDSTFVNNRASGVNGGAISAGSGLTVAASSGGTTLFAGNKINARSSPEYNSISLNLNGGGDFIVNPEAGGVVDMRDPFAVSSTGVGAVHIALRGGGVWRLGGANTAASAGVTNFVVENGVLDLYGQGGASIGLDGNGLPESMAAGSLTLGNNSSFTLKNGATLAARGVNGITADTIGLDNGSTLSFDLSGYEAGKYMLNLTGSMVIAGARGQVDLLSLGQGSGGSYDLVSATSGDFSGFADLNRLTLRGENLVQTRAAGVVTGISDAPGLLSIQLDAWKSKVLAWKSTGGTTWDATSSGVWLDTSTGDDIKFLHGDRVAFYDVLQGSEEQIEILAAGIVASQIDFSGQGTFKFTGGGLTADGASASGPSDLPGAIGLLALTGDPGLRVDFTGQTGSNDFKGGVQLHSGTLVVATEYQLGSTLDKLGFDGGFLEIDGQAGFVSSGGLEQRLNIGGDRAGTISLTEGSTMLIAGNTDIQTTPATEGGAIYVGQDAKFTQTAEDNAKLTLAGNSALKGSGLYAALGAEVELAKVDFIGNNASDYQGSPIIDAGGAIYLAQDAKATIKEAVFISNETGYGSGGAIYLNAGAEADLTGADFIDNQAGENGGAIYLAEASRLSQTGGSYSAGYAERGGALYLEAGAEAGLTGVDFTGNYGEQQGGAIFNNGRLELSNVSFINNRAGDLEGGAIYNAAGSMIKLNVEADQTSVFSGNMDYYYTGYSAGQPRSNSIHFAKGSSLQVNTAAGALLDMRDGMVGHNDGIEAITIRKSGQGRWRLAGENAFTVSGGDPRSSTNFSVDEGALELAAGTTINLDGDSSSFAIQSGARLDVNRGVAITAGNIALNGGSTLGFNVAAQTDKTEALLTLTTGGRLVGLGSELTVDLLSSPIHKGQQYLLAQGGDFASVGSYTLTVLGESLIGTRGENAYQLSQTSSELYLTQTGDISNYALTWTNAAASGQWNTTDENWIKGGQSPEKYYAGDAVVFTGEAAGAVNISSGGASVASMTVTGGEHVFTGGALRGLAGGSTLGAGHYGQLAISGGGAEFRNRAAFDGGVTVKNGSLKLAAGSQLAADTAVNSDGRLALAGTAHLGGSVAVADGGLLEIGSGGYITGDLTLASGSILDIVGRDKLMVNGAASLDDGLTARLTYDQWASGDLVTLMQAGSLSGSFTEDELTVAAFKGRLYADDSDKTLKLEVTEAQNPVETIGGSFNQKSTVGAVMSLDNSNPVKDILTLPTIAETKKAADLVSGEGQVSTAGAILNLARAQGTHTANRIADLYKPNFNWAPSAGYGPDRATSLWVSIGGSRTAIDGNSNAAKTRLTGPEASIGLDGRLGDGWLTGVSFTYAGLESKVDSRRFEADIDAYGLTAYFGKEVEVYSGRWRLVAGGGYTRYDIDSERTAAFRGFHERLKADYSADALTFFGEAAFAFPVSCAMALEPYLNLSWSRLEVDSWREKGGAAALRGRSETYDGLTTLLGLRTYANLSDRVDLRLNLGWQHAFGDIDSEGVHAFRDGSDQFRIRGVSASRNSALAGLGLEVNLTDSLDLTVGYDGLFGNDSQSHSGTASLIWNW